MTIRLLLAISLLLAAPLASAQEVTVLALFKDRAVVVVDGQRQLLKVGERTANGVKLLAADSESATLEVGGRPQRFTLGTQISSSYGEPAPPEVRVWPSGDGMYHIDGRINGLFVSFLMDTGASFVTLSSSQARRVGIDYRTGEPIRLETASGEEIGYRVALNSLVIGDIRLQQVPAVVLEGDFPSTALLGLSALEQLELARDGRAMVLKARW